MMRRAHMTVGGALLVGLVLVAAADAEIVDVAGSTTVEVKAIYTDDSEQLESVALAYPEDSDTLPLQAVARLVDPNEDAAAIAAAQFADPRTSTGSDPDEFAINLALNSIADDVRYIGSATAEELRTVQHEVGEIAGTAAGSAVRLRGRLFLDGALAIFAGDDASDLTGTRVTLHVRVKKEVADAEAETLFDGTLEVVGGPERQVIVSASGDFPAIGLFDTDLAGTDPELSVFRAFIFPSLVINYPYQAVVGEEFDLRATVEVTAANLPGEVGVAAVLGTPVDALAEVMGETAGDEAASKRLATLQRERAAPTGTPVTLGPPAAQRLSPLLPACGVLGLEMAVGALALVELRGRLWKGV